MILALWLVFSVIGYCASGTRERCRNKLGCALERGKTVMNEGAKSFLVDTLHCIDQNTKSGAAAFILLSLLTMELSTSSWKRGGAQTSSFSRGSLWSAGGGSLVCVHNPLENPPAKKLWTERSLLRRNMYTRLRRQILLRNQYDVKSDRNMESYYFLGSRSSILRPAIGETAHNIHSRIFRAESRVNIMSSDWKHDSLLSNDGKYRHLSHRPSIPHSTSKCILNDDFFKCKLCICHGWQCLHYVAELLCISSHYLFVILIYCYCTSVSLSLPSHLTKNQIVCLQHYYLQILFVVQVVRYPSLWTWREWEKPKRSRTNV